MSEHLWRETKEMASKFDIVVYKETNENWCGSYRFEHTESGMYLRVSFHWYFPGNNWNVTVWGNDDFGMGKYELERNAAMELFMKVIQLPFVTKSELKKLGFEIA
jgi:hypothetical protein